MAKKLLNDKGVDFEEKVLDGKNEELQALRQKTGMRTVPQIFINDELIGGYDELNELNETGQLENKLRH